MRELDQQCEHPWWLGVISWLLGMLAILVLAAIGGLTCGVMVRAYTWAAGG